VRTSIALLISVVVLVSACGGGSKSSNTTPTANPCGVPGSSAGCGETAVATTPPVASGQIDVHSFDGIPQDGLTLGSVDAPVKIDLYQNFLCSHCRDFALDVLPHLITDYVATGKVSITFHDTAFGGSDTVENAHSAAHCAADQGRFWPAYVVLYQNYAEDDATYTKSNLESLLQQTGVDATELANCLDTDQHKAEVDASTDAFTHLPDKDAAYASQLATVTAAQGAAIPLFVINGVYLTAPEGYDPIRALILSKLQD
jgi:protein-disulfide isomerase